MISQWQAKHNALMRARCVPCRGTGALDNAQLHGQFFVEWPCSTCNGSGFAPQPIEHQPPSGVVQAAINKSLDDDMSDFHT